MTVKPIQQLRNIGPRSAQWLRECGITTVEELQSIGAVAAFRLVKCRQSTASRNLLWALAAGLQDRDWRELSENEKSALSADAFQ